MNQNSLSKCNRHINAQTDKDTEKDEDEEITQQVKRKKGDIKKVAAMDEKLLTQTEVQARTAKKN